MSNKDKFDFFLKYDLNKVDSLYKQEKTETDEWKISLESLLASVSDLLQDMDMGE